MGAILHRIVMKNFLKWYHMSRDFSEVRKPLKYLGEQHLGRDSKRKGSEVSVFGMFKR